MGIRLCQGYGGFNQQTRLRLLIFGNLQSAGARHSFMRRRAMFYVYFIKSVGQKGQKYIGYTTDLKQRIAEHNNAESAHTAKYTSWILETYFAFQDKGKAHAFELYLKTGAGRAFLSKHF